MDGRNEKEIAKFLGERFVLKKDPPDKYGRDIYKKETDDFVDTLGFINSWVIMPKSESAKPEVILEETFKENFVSVDKTMTLKKAKTLKEKKDVLKGFWFVEGVSKSVFSEHLFCVLPTKKEAEDKVEKLKEIYNPHEEGDCFNYRFFITNGIEFDYDLSGQM